MSFLSAAQRKEGCGCLSAAQRRGRRDEFFISKLGREKKYLELFGSLIESSYLCHRIIKD